MKNKSDLKAKIRTFLTNLKVAGLNVRFIRCDDSGKNMKMKNDPEIKSFSNKLEFSCHRNPQRYGKADRKF
jgi:hypothetical protein